MSDPPGHRMIDIASQIGWVHDFIKIILISYCMIDNYIKLVVICFGLKS